MKRYIVFFAVLVLLCLTLQAQNMKILKVDDITPELSVYPCGDRPEALVVIHCNEDFDIKFASNVDSELDISELSDSTERVYNIIFQTKANGTSFKGRRLEIIVNGFSRYYLPLELKEKQKLEFLISDPYSSLRSLFYTSTEDGVHLFETGEYMAAKDKFVIARQCPEYATVENSLDTYISQCDSMILWSSIVDQAENNNDYSQAKEYLYKMRYMNPTCNILLERYNSVSTELNRQSTYDMNVGVQYMEDRKYALARERFEHAIAIKSPSATQAALYLESINRLNYKADNHTRSLFYENTGNCPIGILTASLKPDKLGGYFSLGFNVGCFDVLSNKLEPVENPKKSQFEVAASAGWTICLYYPKDNMYIPHIWLLATPFGYSGGGFVYSDSNGKTANKKNKYYNAVAPELGVAIRVWRIALNYRLQYRYVFTNEDIGKDILGGIRHSFGIGYCW